MALHLEAAPMRVVRLADNFGETQWLMELAGAFDLTTPLSTWQIEAQARGMAVIVMVSIVDLDTYYGPQAAAEGEQNDEPDEPG